MYIKKERYFLVTRWYFLNHNRSTQMYITLFSEHQKKSVFQASDISQ